MSVFINEDVAKTAFALVKPTFEKLVTDGMTGGRTNLHVIVFKPNTDEILYQESWGDDPSTWKLEYDKVALAKGKLAHRTGMVPRTLRTDAPWLYESGDTRYVGAVIEAGLIVSASGLQDYWDECISWMVLCAIQAIGRGAIADIPSDAPAFLP